jgi:hypothetical protein
MICSDNAMYKYLADITSRTKDKHNPNNANNQAAMNNPIGTHIAIPQITVYQLRDNASSKKQILHFELYFVDRYIILFRFLVNI